jgi:hypothetical protein
MHETWLTLLAIASTISPYMSASGESSFPDNTKVATPKFSLPAGNYLGSQTVSITDATAKSTIYYTTNGATPTTGSAKYSVPLMVAATETLKAIAVATGDTNSAVASAAYTISASAVPFYIPGFATPTTPAGKSGLFVVPSNAPTSAPTFISSTAREVLDLTVQISLSSSGVGAYEPYALVYLDKGGDLLYHVYGLALDATTSKPKPAQISSLGLAAASDLCDASSGQTNVVEPTTLFFLLQTAGADGICGDSDDVFEVIHYLDGAATPPHVVSVHTAKFAPIYSTSGGSPGPLGGMVLLDPATAHLQFYANPTFTAPKTIATGVGSYQNLSLDLQTQLAGNPGEFFEVTSSNGVQSLYRISTTGAAVSEYTASGTLSFGITDLANLYFIDEVAATHVESIWQEPLIGGTPVKLLARSYAADQYDSLVGSDGIDLVIGSLFFTSNASSLSTVPVGKVSTSARQIAAFNGSLTASLHPATPGVATSSEVVFANLTQIDAKGFHYSSEAIRPDGTIVSVLTANTQYLGGVGSATGAIFQVRGITDLSSGYGGAKLYSVQIGSGAATPFTASGTDYVVPANVILVGFGAISSIVGVGNAPVVGTSLPSGVGLVYSVGSTVLEIVALPNTEVGVL